MLYKATSTLDGYLPPLQWTDNKSTANLLLVGGKPIDLSEFPKLRGIFKTGVGTDNLPFQAAAERGITIALPSEATCEVIYEETAAFTCHLILTGLYAGAGSWGSWSKQDRSQLAHRRLLVVGAGRIGQRVIDKMSALMDVDSFDTARDPADALRAKICLADCVSLHVPLTDQTRALMNAERLGWMRDGALLVNTARGAIIDEEALHAELEKGRLRVALDVFWQEPYRGRLVSLASERLILTPHVASTCKEFLEGCARDFLVFVQRLDDHSSVFSEDQCQ